MLLWHLAKLVFLIGVLVVIVACVQSSRRKKKTWSFDAGGHQHTVDLQHGVWFGKRVVTLDGRSIEDARSFIAGGSETRFDVDAHPCILKIRSSALTFDYELYVDGKLV